MDQSSPAGRVLPPVARRVAYGESPWPDRTSFLSSIDVAPFPAYIPPSIDMDAVKAQVAAGGVSAPAADVPDLRQVVADARQDGIDLKIVVVDANPPIDTPLRDIATVVGQANPGSTVLVLSPSSAGYLQPHLRPGAVGGRRGSGQIRQSRAVGAEFRQSAEHADISVDRAVYRTLFRGIADRCGDPNPSGAEQTRCHG